MSRLNKKDTIKKKIKENEEQLKKEQHILSYTSLIAINHQLRDELVNELEIENAKLLDFKMKILTCGIVETLKAYLRVEIDNQEHIENENMLLRTKLAMYQELDRLRKDFIEQLARRYNFHYLDINIKELEKQIKSLDKKCDGECEI